MYFLENVRLAFTALKANKLRSILTMLGIIIGICAVITITSIGNSLKETLSNAFNTLEGRNIYTTYDYIEEGALSVKRLSDSDTITSEMLDDIERLFSGKILVERTNGIGTGTLHNSKGKDVTVNVSGASEGFIKSNSYFYKLIKGRYPSTEDNEGKKHTILVSDLFAEQYFNKGEEPLGKDLDIFIDGIGKIHFTIVGVFRISESYISYMGESGKSRMELTTPVFIPYYTSTYLKAAEKDSMRFPTFYVADKRLSLEDAQDQLQEYLDTKYKNAKYWKPYLYNYMEDSDEISKYMNILTIVLAIIAAISLLVGGIGVMNIMMVSITERTREIGIRKALGAKNGAIRIQFLIESAILCLVGGILGILLGMFNGFLVETVGNMIIDHLPEYQDLVTLNIQLSIPAIILALIFSTIIGVFFGSYPASKAAKLDPIEALRYE